MRKYAVEVAVVDYGCGNLGSLMRALEELGARPKLLTYPVGLAEFSRIVLPGVGNFSEAMALLQGGCWIEPLKAAVHDRAVPLLGVCLGMQLLAERGDEGAPDTAGTLGLGFLRGRVRHLRAVGCRERVPHVGWNEIYPAECPLFAGIPKGTDFYFVHSYALEVEEPPTCIATVDYGGCVTAAVGRGKVFGTQFHPEKSAGAGFRVLRNFLELTPC